MCVWESCCYSYLFLPPFILYTEVNKVEPILSLPLGKIRLKIIMENDKIIQLLSGRDFKCKFT